MKLFNCIICGIEKPTSYSKANKYCSTECYIEGAYRNKIQKWKDGELTGNKGINSIQVSGYVRRYIEEKFDYKCACCGQGKEWNGRPLSLQLEHLDGNSSNSREENLSILCPNCHTQTEFYGSKNKGNGRGSIFKRR
jgi:5-methylcytosine-specific restriction endonuclease McrA